MSLTSETDPRPVDEQPRFTLRPIGCAVMAFLLGLVVGVGGLVLYASASQGDRAPVSVPPASNQSAIHMQLSSVLITQVVKRNIGAAGLPGQISNVQVVLTKDNPMVVTGDDQFDVLGFAITRHFTLTLQPFVQSCRPHVHILHADMGGIPVTGFAASFESQIDQQLQLNTNDLPQGFTYCTTSVQTEKNALSVDIAATPIVSRANAGHAGL